MTALLLALALVLPDTVDVERRPDDSTRALVAQACAIVPACSMYRLAPPIEHVRPGPVWRLWFERTADCLELQGSAEDATWFLVAGIHRIDERHTPSGMHRTGAIHIVSRGLDDEKLIRHEAIHYLLWANGLDADAGHEGPWWERCEVGVRPGAAPARANVRTGG